MRSTLLALTLSLSAILAGCSTPSESGSTSDDANPNTSTPTAGTKTNARFEIAALTISPKGDPNATSLHEDDAGATIRYTIRQPADAPRESAFVTFLLNGRIVDVLQLTLAGGQEKSYERSVGDLRANRTIKVEVRAAGAVARAEATVADWPRAGTEALSFGPLSIRADYGLMEQDGRVLVNLTLDNVGPEQPFKDFRVKMLCVDAAGKVEETSSVRLDAPTLGNATGTDVVVADCPQKTRYGLEFKATGADAKTMIGRLLLVPKGWTPAPAAP